MTFHVLLISFLICISVSADTNTLTAKKEALLLEYTHVQNAPGTFYLIVDLETREALLKADANLLRTCKILNSFGGSLTQTTQMTLNKHISPHTPEPETISRKRNLPLDFTDRLTKGPKHRSRLYFMPPFLIQSAQLPTPQALPGIQLSNQDTKAIASALPLHATIIVMPAAPQNPGISQ